MKRLVHALQLGLVLFIGVTTSAQVRLIAHIANDSAHFRNTLAVANFSDLTRSYELFAYDDLGQPMGGLTNQIIEGYTTRFVDATDLFPELPSYLLVESDADVVVSMGYTSTDSSGATARVHESTQTSKGWRLYPSNGASTFDGLVVLNLTDSMAQVSIEQKDASGGSLDATSLQVFPGHKEKMVLSTYFDTVENTCFEVIASEPVAVMALTGSLPGITPSYLWENPSVAFTPIAAEECTSSVDLDRSRGPCNETLPYSPQVSISVDDANRTITSNNIPDHQVGLFGPVFGSLNPNAIAEQHASYTITARPEWADEMTALLGPNGPTYRFGVLFNGVELDPVAAEPFPHEGGFMNPNANWAWNLEALNVRIGLDCNNAHVQPNGKYHYHGTPVLYLQDLNINDHVMTMIGYAADGFPIYYKYAYSDANNPNSAVIEMTSSYRLKSGIRPGDGITAPCGTYNGVYSADYEFVSGLGTLDEANGRFGVTPEYPQGIYYYVITDAFPSIPRYLRGTPSSDFRLRP
ncbi:MAG: YHYH protein [Acidobacteria bacterium]|nr:YHYH protein [Acidobacteriota bacterium]